MIPLELEFGWDRSVVSAAASLNILLFGLVGPFAAGLMNRFGIKRVMLASLAITASGVFLATQVSTPRQLIFSWGLLVGTGTGMASLVLGTAIVNRWFHAKRGVVLGALTGANATGQLLFLPAMAYSTEQVGWRFTVRAILIFLAVLVPVVYFWMKDRPSDVGLKPYGLESDDAAIETQKINPFRDTWQALLDGLKSKEFWLLSASFFVCGASTNGLIGTHLIPACVDHGIPEIQAAGLLAMMGVFDLVGTTGSGWLSDRFDSRKLLFMYYGLRGLSLLYLPFALSQFESGALTVFAVFYGLDWIATVPPTVALTTQIFGRERAPMMFGWIVAFHQVGASSTALFAGWIRSSQGNYSPAFAISGTLCLITAFMVLAIGRKRAMQAMAT